MLARLSPSPDRTGPVTATAAEAGASPLAAELASRITRCVEAARPQKLGAPRRYSLQWFDLMRLRVRLGARWSGLRSRAITLLVHGLERELGPDEFWLDGGADHLFVVRCTTERRAVERSAELLAAEVTSRLCGTIPGGAIIRVVTQPFDPSELLHVAATRDDVLSALEHLARGSTDPGSTPADANSGLRARYLPLLNVRKRLVSAYRLAAAADGSQVEAVEPAWLEALDTWSVREATIALNLPSPGCGPALLVPVHYATLARMTAREHLARLCRRLPQRSSRQLAFEVLGLPSDLPEPRLRELLAYLRPFCAGLVLRLPGAACGVAHLAACGVRAVSVTPADLTWHDGAADPLGVLVGRARVAGLRTILDAVASSQQYRVAVAAGIDHVAGGALMPPLSRPGRAFMVTRTG